jgi:hypothetical protein
MATSNKSTLAMPVKLHTQRRVFTLSLRVQQIFSVKYRMINETVRWHSGNFSEFWKTFSGLLISHVILLYSSYVQKIELIQINTKQQQTPTPPACHKTTVCRTEVMVQIVLPHGAGGPVHLSCTTFMCVTLNNESPSKLQLWLLRATSRSRKRHCMVIKNQGWTRSGEAWRATLPPAIIVVALGLHNVAYCR